MNPTGPGRVEYALRCASGDIHEQSCRRDEPTARFLRIALDTANPGGCGPHRMEHRHTTAWHPFKQVKSKLSA